MNPIVRRGYALMSRMILGLFPIMCIMLVGQASCKLLESRTSSLSDYDNNNKFIIDGTVGDKFVTLKPMFLSKLAGEGLSLDKPGIGAPSLEQYAEAPTKYRNVIRLVPEGTVLELVAIKAGRFAPLHFIRIEGVSEWVWVSFCEYTKVGNNHHLQYNREYFQKIESAAISPKMIGKGPEEGGHVLSISVFAVE